MQQLQIVVLEDLGRSLRAIVGNLEREGFSVIGCQDQEEAIQKLSLADFVLTDLKTPSATGLSDQLLAAAASKKIPAAVMSENFDEMGCDEERLKKRLNIKFEFACGKLGDWGEVSRKIRDALRRREKE